MSKAIQRKTPLSTILFATSLVGITVGLNIISNRFFQRFDTTKEKVYTLSQGSKDLVRNLPDRMNVKVFISEELPPDSRNHAQFARDLLNEYAAFSSGKMHIETIKMKGDETEKEKQASECKVRKITRGERSKNKLEIASTFLGICFDYHGQIESIPAVEQVEGLEFAISGLIKQMTVKKKKLAFASSEGELTPQQGLQYFAEHLKNTGYETTSVDLKAAIPEDVDALLIVGPKGKFSERALYVIDQFLMTGKAVAIFVDGQTMTTPQGPMVPGVEMPKLAQPNETGLEELLGSYGVILHHDFVLDRQNAVGPVPYEGKYLPRNHPVFVVAGPLEQTDPITKGVQIAIFPYVSSLDLISSAKEGNSSVRFTEIAKSSKSSWSPAGPFIFDPNLQDQPASADVRKGPFSLAYMGVGSFKSHFAEKQRVKEDGTKVDEKQSVEGLAPLLKSSKEGTRLVVIGGSEFISDRYLGLVRQGLQFYISNLVLGINIADWLVQDEALALVRNKGMQTRPLKEVSAATANFIKVGNIVGIPLLVCVVGIVRWRIRQSRRKSIKFSPNS